MSELIITPGDITHTVEIKLTQPLIVNTTVTFTEPGSGITHTQNVPSVINAGQIICGKMKLEIL